jgi:archaeosine-15-forming tRNA-guanine transglycosylase
MLMLIGQGLHEERASRMPRVDTGMYVVETAEVFSLSRRELLSLRDWALSSRAVFVTSPSIATVDSTSGPLRLALGVGSLVGRERPPIPYRVIKSSEWVDGCAAGATEPRYLREAGEGVRARGVAVAVDYKDPPSLMLNSVRLEAVASRYAEGQPLLILLEDSTGAQLPLLALRGGEYIIEIPEGSAGDLLEYATSLYTSCGPTKDGG